VFPVNNSKQCWYFFFEIEMVSGVLRINLPGGIAVNAEKRNKIVMDAFIVLQILFMYAAICLRCQKYKA